MSKELVDYFILETNKKFEAVDKKLDSLIAFRWQIIGGSLVASSLLTIALNVLIIVLGGK